MRNYWQETSSKVELVVSLMVLLSVLSIFWDKTKYLDYINSWGPAIATSIITTGICQILIQKFFGDSLEKIPIPIRGMPFSVSLFFILTIILKIWLF